MNADIVTQMRAEEADLSRKLQAVRAFLAAYGEMPREASADEAPPRQASASHSREKVEITSFNEQTRRSVLLAMEAMVYSDGLLRTAQLVEYVESRGHQISGANKINALGALLARSLDVKGFGRSGWSVVDRDNAMRLLQKYEYKEKEPTSESAAGPDAEKEGAATPTYSWNQPNLSPAS